KALKSPDFRAFIYPFLPDSRRSKKTHCVEQSCSALAAQRSPSKRSRTAALLTGCRERPHQGVPSCIIPPFR
ncbi:MAG: hypothetical protein ACI4OY_12145, partial [Aristaeellaceae bacterium]